jgi:hypothetical protein
MAMEYLRELKQAAIFGGLILGISLLQNLGIDYYGWLAAFLSFTILLIHDAGRKYLTMTNQPERVKLAFGALVNPLLAVIVLSSIFYVVAGEMHWLFRLGAFFIGFILFVVDGVPLLAGMKKS